MERVFIAQTDFGPFERNHVVLLDDAKEVDRGWIETGYLKEIGVDDGGPEGADRAR